MSRGRQLLVRYAALWLVPLAICVAPLLAEGLLRLNPQLLPEDAQVKRLWQSQTRTSSIGDPYLGSVYAAHYQTTISSLDFSFKVDSDEHGFRNPSPWPEQADIVVVGDSFAYGWGVEYDQSWTTLLADQLPDNRLITLGMPGTVPQQYYRYFERFGVGLKPKLVLFGIYVGNDITDAPIFERWLAAGSPGNYKEWRSDEGRAPTRRARLLQNSYLGLFIRSMRRGRATRYESKTIALNGGEKLQLVPMNYERALKHDDPRNAAFARVVEATVAARDLARVNGSQFLVVLFPPKESVYLPLHGEPFPTLTDTLDSALQQQGIDCLDMIGALQGIAARGERLYFEIDGHLNERGQQVVADTLVGYMREHSTTLGAGWLHIAPAPPSG